MTSQVRPQALAPGASGGGEGVCAQEQLDGAIMIFGAALDLFELSPSDKFDVLELVSKLSLSAPSRPLSSQHLQLLEHLKEIVDRRVVEERLKEARVATLQKFVRGAFVRASVSLCARAGHPLDSFRELVTGSAQFASNLGLFDDLIDTVLALPSLSPEDKDVFEGLYTDITASIQALASSLSNLLAHYPLVTGLGEHFLKQSTLWGKILKYTLRAPPIVKKLLDNAESRVVLEEEIAASRSPSTSFETLALMPCSFFEYFEAFLCNYTIELTQVALAEARRLRTLAMVSPSRSPSKRARRLSESSESRDESATPVPIAQVKTKRSERRSRAMSIGDVSSLLREGSTSTGSRLKFRDNLAAPHVAAPPSDDSAPIVNVAEGSDNADAPCPPSLGTSKRSSHASMTSSDSSIVLPRRSAEEGDVSPVGEFSSPRASRRTTLSSLQKNASFVTRKSLKRPDFGTVEGSPPSSPHPSEEASLLQDYLPPHALAQLETTWAALELLKDYLQKSREGNLNSSLSSLAQRFVDADSDLFHNRSRTLLREIEATYKKKAALCFLFSDLLLVATKVKEEKKTVGPAKLQIECSHDLASVRIILERTVPDSTLLVLSVPNSSKTGTKELELILSKANCVEFMVTLKQQLEISSTNIFGVDVGVLSMRKYERILPTPIVACLDHLLAHGKVQGLFRVSGSTAKLTEFAASLNRGLVSFPVDTDPHVISNAIKQFVREIPGGLVPFSLYSTLVSFAEGLSDSGSAADVAKLRDILQTIPSPNLALLGALCKSLAMFLEPSFVEVTKMDLQNLSLVFASNIIRQEVEDPISSAAHITYLTTITRMMIGQANELFVRAGPSEASPKSSWLQQLVDFSKQPLQPKPAIQSLATAMPPARLDRGLSTDDAMKGTLHKQVSSPRKSMTLASMFSIVKKRSKDYSAATTNESSETSTPTGSLSFLPRFDIEGIDEEEGFSPMGLSKRKSRGLSLKKKPERSDKRVSRDFEKRVSRDFEKERAEKK